jgi:hypothetical protein
MRSHIGPYQRPAPPKKPLGLGAPKAIQQPVVPMHEIEAQAQVVLQGMIEDGRVLGIVARKAGRPSVHEASMTPAERQARRRSIQDAQSIGDGDGKSRLEAASGGRGSTELDILAVKANDEGNGTIGLRRVKPKPASDKSADDEKESSTHKVQVRGLQIGDENANRCLFAENELKKMVGEYFESPAVNPSARWVARHVSSAAIQQQCSPSLALTCKVCGSVTGSMDDAADHLRVGHRTLICEWFKRLNPPREFRDMRSYVTVVIPRRRKSLQKQALMSD